MTALLVQALPFVVGVFAGMGWGYAAGLRAQTRER